MLTITVTPYLRYDTEVFSCIVTKSNHSEKKTDYVLTIIISKGPKFICSATPVSKISSVPRIHNYINCLLHNTLPGDIIIYVIDWSRLIRIIQSQSEQALQHINFITETCEFRRIKLGLTFYTKHIGPNDVANYYLSFDLFFDTAELKLWIRICPEISIKIPYELHIIILTETQWWMCQNTTRK